MNGGARPRAFTLPRLGRPGDWDELVDTARCEHAHDQNRRRQPAAATRSCCCATRDRLVERGARAARRAAERSSGCSRATREPARRPRRASGHASTAWRACVVRALHPDATAVDVLTAGGTRDARRGPRRRGSSPAFFAGAALPFATVCASTSPTAAPGSAATRTASCRRSATSTCTSSTRARTASSGRRSARTCARSTDSRGRQRSPCGRRTRAASASSATSAAGTAGSSRCARSAARACGSSSCPSVEPGALYKFEILTREGALRLKTDPFAATMEQCAGHRVASSKPRARTPGATTRGCAPAAIADHDARADGDLRSAPRLVGARARGGQPLAHLSRDRAAARRARPARSASRTSSCCPSWSIRSTARGAIR